MTVISASYKTDIPAFYGEWFSRRLEEGAVDIRNPYNNRVSSLSLLPCDVDAFVFWTRNAGPFLPVLSERVEGKYPFYFQYTVTGYPREIERSVIDAAEAIAQIRELSGRYGRHSVVWRYDPIFVSDRTPISFHLENFQRLANLLEGAVNEVTVSFAQLYAKTRRNLDRLARRHPVGFQDPTLLQKQEMMGELAEKARQVGMNMTLCTQPCLETDAVSGAACIDRKRIAAVGGPNLDSRLQRNREGCLCISSRDIGSYDTCPHGCVYCYAVKSQEKAKAAIKSHDRGLSVL